MLSSVLLINLAAGETGELMMTCDMELMDSAECTEPHGDPALTCSSDGCMPDDSVLYYVAGYIAFKLKQFTQCTVYTVHRNRSKPIYNRPSNRHAMYSRGLLLKGNTRPVTTTANASPNTNSPKMTAQIYTNNC